MRQIADYHNAAADACLDIVFIGEQMPISLHTHGRFKELVVVFSGQCRHLTATGSYPLKKGDVFLIPEDTPHGYSDVQNVRLVNILYIPDRLRLPEHDIASIPGYHALNSYNPQEKGIQHFGGPLGMGFEALKTIDILAKMIDTEIERKQPGWLFASSGFLMQILCLIARSCLDRLQPAQAGMASLSRVLGHMDAAYPQKLTVSELARMACLSESSFNRLFRRVMGESPTEYLLRLRVDKAAQRLISTDDTVERIAHACGFHDTSHFSRFFKRITGQPPSDFRRQLRRSSTDGASRG